MSQRSGRRIAGRGSIFTAALIGMIAMAAAAGAGAATTITVTSTDDTSESATDCVLRDAISVANAGGGTVNACSATTDTAFTIEFQSGVTGTITLGSALPTITGNLTINGPTTSPGITIDGNNAYNLLVMGSESTLNVNNLTIADGNGTAEGGGGGIHDELGLSLTVTNCTFINNTSGSAETAGGRYRRSLWHSDCDQ